MVGVLLSAMGGTGVRQMPNTPIHTGGNNEREKTAEGPKGNTRTEKGDVEEMRGEMQMDERSENPERMNNLEESRGDMAGDGTPKVEAKGRENGESQIKIEKHELGKEVGSIQLEQGQEGEQEVQMEPLWRRSTLQSRRQDLSAKVGRKGREMKDRRSE